MFYYIQSNNANEWKPAMDSQIETMKSCIENKSDVKFVITDPISGKSFNSVCKFSNDHCYFHNLETNMVRMAIWSEKELPDLDGPAHDGATIKSSQ